MSDRDERGLARDVLVHVDDALVVIVDAVKRRGGGLEAHLEGEARPEAERGCTAVAPQRFGTLHAVELRRGCGTGGDQREGSARVVREIDRGVTVRAARGGCGHGERKECEYPKSQDADGINRRRLLKRKSAHQNS